MAKSRHRTNRKTYSKKIKDPKWSKGKKFFMTVIGIVLGALAVIAIIGAVLKYYRLVSK